MPLTGAKWRFKLPCEMWLKTRRSLILLVLWIQQEYQ